MQNKLRHFKREMGLFLLCWMSVARVWASDGFDNNYVSSNANQLAVRINNENFVFLFGPGAMSGAGFYLPIPNGINYNLGAVTQFNLTNVSSFMRSAYFDRVISATFYYRIFSTLVTPPSVWDSVVLIENTPLPANNCYGNTQLDPWDKNLSINVLNGLDNGTYALEYYVKANLYDVGAEPDPCGVIDINGLCDANFVNPGRYLSSRFNTVDPTACNYMAVMAAQSDPTKVLFQVSGPLPLVWKTLEAKVVHTGVELHWQTAEKEQLAYFSVERSTNGWQWEKLGQVGAASVGGYQWVDQRPVAGQLYYRLREVDLDGGQWLSNVVPIRFGETLPMLKFFPNPASFWVFWEAGSRETEASYLSIRNEWGRLEAKIPTPSNNTLDLRAWASGLYFIEFEDANGRPVGSGRFLKQ